MIEDSDYCYKMYQNGKNFNQAAEQCRKDGGKLLQIESELENEEVHKYTRNKVDQSGSIWLGLKQTSNKRWVWEPKNKLLDFERWADGQPNATFTRNCGSMQSSGIDAGYWNVHSCDNLHPYACMSLREGNTIICYIHFLQFL